MEYRIVYGGPPGSGTTSNLEFIRSVISRGELADSVRSSVSSIGKSPFDLLHFEIDQKTKGKLGFRLFSLPSAEDFRHLWKMILWDCHAIVIVLDSQFEKLEENQVFLRKIHDFLRSKNTGFEEFPVLLQYNKRDLPGAVPHGELDEKLNLFRNISISSAATRGEGVLYTLMKATRMLLHPGEVGIEQSVKLTEGLL